MKSCFYIFTLIRLCFHEVFIKTKFPTNCGKKPFSIWCSFIRFCSNSVHPDRFPFFCQEICLTWLFFSISGHFQDKSSYILSYIGGAPTKRGNPMSKISSKWSSRIWERESAANFKGATQLQTITTNNNTANWKKKKNEAFVVVKVIFYTKKRTSTKPPTVIAHPIEATANLRYKRKFPS